MKVLRRILLAGVLSLLFASTILMVLPARFIDSLPDWVKFFVAVFLILGISVEIVLNVVDGKKILPGTSSATRSPDSSEAPSSKDKGA